MRKILVSILFLTLTLPLAAQSQFCESVYKKYYDEGIAKYNKGHYKEAAKAFSQAHCPRAADLSAAKSAELDKWAKKCQQAMNNAARKAKPAAKEPVAVSKPMEKTEVEVLYANYLRATCNGSVRGAQMELLVTAKNLRDNKLRVCALISPQNGSGKVNNASPMASQYTVEGDLAGEEQEVKFADGDICSSVTVFVPFSVMDFSGDYSAQMMKADIYVYMTGNNTPVTEYHGVYDALSPHTITLDGQIGDYELEVGFLGGLLELQPAVCSGNEVLWTDIPSWITKDAAGFHIDGNDSPDSRSATIHVSSSGGGNVINLIITQNGRGEGDRSTTVVNRVWLEEVMRNPARNLKQLNVHVAFEINGAQGKEVSVCAYFFCPDGITPLLDENGNQVMASGKGYCDYAESAFDDFPIAMWLNSVTNAKNNTANEARYFILISEDGGKSFISRSGPFTISW